MLRRLKTFLWYYLQAGFAVAVLWLSDQVSHPDRFPTAWVIFAQGVLVVIITVPLVAIILRTKELERRRERLGKYVKFLVLFVAWLISLINQAFGGIITNLVPLVVIPVPVFQGFLIAVILIILGLVAGLLWIIDVTRIIAEVPKRSHTILDYRKEEPEKRSPIAGILRWLRRRHTNTAVQ